MHVQTTGTRWRRFWPFQWWSDAAASLGRSHYLPPSHSRVLFWPWDSQHTQVVRQSSGKWQVCSVQMRVHVQWELCKSYPPALVGFIAVKLLVWPSFRIYQTQRQILVILTNAFCCRLWMVIMTEELDEVHSSWKTVSLQVIFIHRFQAWRRRGFLERRRRLRVIKAGDKQGLWAEPTR